RRWYPAAQQHPTYPANAATTKYYRRGWQRMQCAFHREKTREGRCGSAARSACPRAAIVWRVSPASEFAIATILSPRLQRQPAAAPTPILRSTQPSFALIVL